MRISLVVSHRVICQCLGIAKLECSTLLEVNTISSKVCWLPFGSYNQLLLYLYRMYCSIDIMTAASSSVQSLSPPFLIDPERGEPTNELSGMNHVTHWWRYCRT